MDPITLLMVRIFDLLVARRRRPKKVFQRSALSWACGVATIGSLVHCLVVFSMGRYESALSFTLPIAIVSILVGWWSRRSSHAQAIAIGYVLFLASFTHLWLYLVGRSIFTTAFIWNPLFIAFAVFISGYRWAFLTSGIIVLEAILLLLVNSRYGFVLVLGISPEQFERALLSTVILSCAAGYIVVWGVERNRRKTESAIKRSRQLNLYSAQQSVTGAMAQVYTQPWVHLIEQMVEEVRRLREGDQGLEFTEAVKKMQQQTQQCLATLQSLNILSQNPLDAERSSIRLDELAGQARSLCLTRATSVGVSLDVEAEQGETLVSLPVASILFVMAALINNAIDAAKAQKQAWVRVGLRRHGEGFQLHVTDSGVGISGAERHHIFEPFVTTHAEEKALGIGLSLSLEIIQRAGGRLELDPYSPETCFRCSIPLGRATVEERQRKWQRVA